MYHRIAERRAGADWHPTGWRPAQFERQLAYLRRHGYRTITIAEWQQALPERTAASTTGWWRITFDDAYRDFLTEAWPLLRRYGFNATMFVPTDHVGGRAEWDRAVGEPAPLLGWHELRTLAARGAGHRRPQRLAPLSDAACRPADMLAEGRRSKERLEANSAGQSPSWPILLAIRTLLVRRAMAACGFIGAVTTAPGLSRLGDNPMALPRQLVDGADDMDAFIAKLGRPDPRHPRAPACATAMSAGPART